MNQSYPDVFGDFIEKLCESIADVGMCEVCEHAYPRSEMKDGICSMCDTIEDADGPINLDLNPNPVPTNTSLNPGSNK